MASRTHISGIVSGIDTQTYIDQMMEIEQTKIDNKDRNITRSEWKLEIYNELYTQINSLTEKYFSVLGEKSLFSSKAYNTYQVAMDKNNAVSLKTTGNIAMQSLDIVSSKKAKSASFSTSSGVTASLKTVSSSSLLRAVAYGEKGSKAADLVNAGKSPFEYEFSADEYGTYTIGGKTFTIGAEEGSIKTVQELKDKLAEGDDGFVLSFDSASGAFAVESETGKAFSIDDVDGKLSAALGLAAQSVSAKETPKLALSGTMASGANLADVTAIAAGEHKFNVNGVELTVDIAAGDTNQGVIDKINAQLATVGAQLTVLNGKTSLTSSNDAAASLSLELVDGDTSLFGAEGLTGIAAGTRTAKTMNDLFPDATGPYSFTINAGGTDYTVSVDFSGADTVQAAAKSLAQTVTSSVPGVTMSYDEIRGTFTLAADDSTLSSLSVTDASGKLFGENSLTGITAGAVQETPALSSSDTIGAIADKVGGVKTADGKYRFEITSNDGSKELSQTFEFSESDTLSTVMSKINMSSLNVQMTYSQINDSFTLTNKGTGAGTSLSISGDGFKAMGILGPADVSKTETGTDAELKVKVDGSDNVRTITSSSNVFTRDGVEFTVTDDYNLDPLNPKDELHATFTYNASGVVENVKSFITDYNAIIDKISGYMTEKREYDYNPLTEAEKKDMTDDDIEKWEKKAKSGILRDDDTLSSILSSLRSTLYNTVGSTDLSGQMLGITTKTYTSAAGTQYGQLQLDESKLTNALNDNVGKVMTVLAGQEDGAKGVFVRMNTLLSGFTKSMKANKILKITEDIVDMETESKDMYTKMYEKEDKLWSMFGSFESTYSKYTNMSNLIASYFG